MIALNLFITLGTTDTLAIFSVPIYERDVSLYLFRSTLLLNIQQYLLVFSVVYLLHILLI